LKADCRVISIGWWTINRACFPPPPAAFSQVHFYGNQRNDSKGRFVFHIVALGEGTIFDELCSVRKDLKDPMILRQSHKFIFDWFLFFIIISDLSLYFVLHFIKLVGLGIRKHRVDASFHRWHFRHVLNKNVHLIFSQREPWLYIFLDFPQLNPIELQKQPKTKNYHLALFLIDIFGYWVLNFQSIFNGERQIFGQSGVYSFWPHSRGELCFEFDCSNYYNHFLSHFIQN
jgi:hypothetical protein